MTLRPEGFINLPEHTPGGGFDHAAVDHGLRRLYVAHTSNDAVDVIDLDRGSYVESIGGLTGVAGALVDEVSGLVFTSNRGEDSVGIFRTSTPDSLTKVPVGVRPNGLSYDPKRGTLLAANVGDPARPETHTLTVVDAQARSVRGSIPVAGRTRWTVFDPIADMFFVNIADPWTIAVVAGSDPTRVSRLIPIPAAGPHGLDVDAAGRLYCACDEGRLVVLEPPDYVLIADIELAGAPDVIFLDRALRQLYISIGDPGVIQVVDVERRATLEVVPTERGAHTIALDGDRHRVYAFLPESHRAAVFQAQAS